MRSFFGRDGGRGRGGPQIFGDRGRAQDGGGEPGHHRGGHHHGFGGRRGKLFSGDELRLMVLELLSHEPQHGYQLIRGFATRSGDAYAPSPGVLYPLLTLLADMGLVAEVANGTGGRRSFELTEAGRAELAAQPEVAAAALQRLAQLAGDARRIDPAPVRRAMMNLRTAAIQRLSSGEVDAGAGKKLAFAIAEIIDHAARNIERLEPETLP